MAITFERIRDLLVDLEHAINCYDELKRELREILTSTQLDPASKINYIDNVLAAAAAPPRALAQAERRYYNSNHRRNERLRDKQREKRRRTGVPQRAAGYPQMIRTELEARELDAIRTRIETTQTPEEREERTLLACLEHCDKLYRNIGNAPFVKGALYEFTLGLNISLDHIVAQLVARGWLEQTPDGKLIPQGYGELATGLVYDPTPNEYVYVEEAKTSPPVEDIIEF